MILLKSNNPDETIETTMELAGAEFPITLLPLTSKEQDEVFNPFRRKKSVPNPVSGRMELIDILDTKDPKWQAVADDLLDKHVIDFKGIGGNDGKPLDGTVRENKILLGNVVVNDSEEVVFTDPETKEKVVAYKPRKRAFSALIFDKCRELAATVAEVSEKNCGMPYDGCTARDMSITGECATESPVNNAG